MRIGVLGGGPAGLYFALLAKKANPDHEVFVVERNAPDATFGWGVVFSEETLGVLREADHESYLDITDAFMRWSAIDVVYDDEVVRSGGHVFSGVARQRLLQILQERCRSLGVQLFFHEELPDLSRFDDCDLVVAADGVNSTVRKLHSDAFKPTLDVHRSKYVWFGTDLVFDAFTFIFRKSEHGIFQVHAYPFDAQTSTFIVECNQGTWERAELEGLGEQESIAFCEELFAPELAGHKLMSNRSVWISFVTVKCESWHHGNVVLVGDAAHTAHFTIGSGTKLAMEDAMALNDALLAHPGTLEAALTAYEMERQPVVDRFQEAARESATYFENVIRYTHFHPLQFSFQLLTRSGRITHLELERRDPAYLARVDRWFVANPHAGQPAPAAVPPWPQVTPPPPLFARLALGERLLDNRVVLRAVAEDDADDGQMNDVLRERLLELVSLRSGLVTTEFVAASPDGRISPGTPGLYRDPQIELSLHWPVCLLLGHAGRRGATRPRRRGVDYPLREGGWPLLSASPIPYTPRSQVPKEMDLADMQRVLGDFVSATERAAALGAAMLMLDCSHGYLLASFLSPLSNRRTDAYGGSLENRLRYPLEVLDAVRGAWPQGRPLAVRYSATDWAPGGMARTDSLDVALAFKEHGAAILDVMAGQTVAEQRPHYGRFFLVPYSDVVRNELRIPTMTSGNITTADEVNTILAAGRADLVVMDPRRYATA
jgi:anthraniloyl-CoA monooxygenase